MKRFAVLFVAVTGFVTMNVSAGVADDSALLAACESVISGQLDDPTRFSLAGAEEMVTRPATLDDAMGWTAVGSSRDVEVAMASRNSDYFDLLRDKFLSFTDGSFVHLIMIEYRAPNSFGAMKKGRAACSLVTPTEALPEVIDPYSVQVSGRTADQWGAAGELVAYGQDAPLSTSNMLKVLRRLKAKP